MTETFQHQRSLRPTAAEAGLVWFQRIIAAYCLLFGVLYWIRLIGIYPGSMWRFDLMPAYWQVPCVTLAALFPIAAIGLWMLSSWGPVIWFICAAVEMTMYFGFPDLYGHRIPIVVSHVCVALLYGAFRSYIYFQKRSAR